jgi:ribosomal protein S12 methylthiotransferase
VKTHPLGIRIVTMGCSKNLVDSEVLMRQIDANGIYVLHDDQPGNADTIIINTCGFIHDAKQESVDMILHYAQMKSSGQIRRLFITGCLSERYENELKKEIPFLDGVYGVAQLPQIIKDLGLEYKDSLLGERYLTTPSHYAYLKISEGCSRKCSFCAIPVIRGPHTSRSKDEIVSEAGHLADKGIKELILVAQDLSYYGFDLNGTFQLPALLESLQSIAGIEWIRLHYAFPANFPMEVMDLMKNSPQICKYLDIPLQHISDKMLKLMRRGINKKKTIELIQMIRTRVPDIALRTTMLVGHPGETKKDFEELKDFIREARFERLGVFTYSHEEDTYASKTMKNNISETLKQERAEEIMLIQEGISRELNKKKENQVFLTLIDAVGDEFARGRTEFDSPEVDNEVLIKPHKSLTIGNFYPIKITESDSFDLWGELARID